MLSRQVSVKYRQPTKRRPISSTKKSRKPLPTHHRSPNVTWCDRKRDGILEGLHANSSQIRLIQLFPPGLNKVECTRRVKGRVKALELRVACQEISVARDDNTSVQARKDFCAPERGYWEDCLESDPIERRRERVDAQSHLSIEPPLR